MKEEIISCITSLNGMAFGVATAIFLFTMLFVGMRWIGFTITLLLLVFSLAAGITISNLDIIRSYFKSELHGKDFGTGEDLHKVRKQVEKSLHEETSENDSSPNSTPPTSVE